MIHRKRILRLLKNCLTKISNRNKQSIKLNNKGVKKENSTSSTMRRGRIGKLAVEEIKRLTKCTTMSKSKIGNGQSMPFLVNQWNLIYCTVWVTIWIQVVILIQLRIFKLLLKNQLSKSSMPQIFRFLIFREHMYSSWNNPVFVWYPYHTWMTQSKSKQFLTKSTEFTWLVIVRTR